MANFAIVHVSGKEQLVYGIYNDIQSVLLAFSKLIDSTEIKSKSDYIEIYSVSDHNAKKLKNEKLPVLAIHAIAFNSQLIQKFRVKQVYEWEEVQFADREDEKQ